MNPDRRLLRLMGGKFGKEDPDLQARLAQVARKPSPATLRFRARKTKAGKQS